VDRDGGQAVIRPTALADTYGMAPRSSLSRLLASALLLATTAISCAASRPLVEAPQRQVGLASFYAREHHGRRTASGERFDMHAMTAAHRTLPFGTRIRVTNMDNGRRAVLRVNDRGPFRKGRILDVSYAAARTLGFARRGVARIRLVVLG
jgi:rare lipoprotein A